MSESKRLLQSTTYRMRNVEDDLHCMPQDDWFEHLADCNCPCNPKPDEENKRDIQRGYADKVVWVHRQIKYNKEGCH